MSKVSNTNVIVGDTVSTSEVDAKFSDVNTATSSINAENVSYQGVDHMNLKSNYLVVKSGYVDNGVTDATAAMPYSVVKNGSAGSGAQPLSHLGSTASSTGLLLDFRADPLVLKDGDLLRVWHACHLYKHEWGNFLYIKTGAYGIENLCAATYPMLSYDSNLSTPNFLPFPGISGGWMDNTDSGAEKIEIQQPDYSGSDNYRSYGVALYPLHGTKIGTTEMRVRYTGGSTLNYQHQGSDITIYGIRVFLYAALHYKMQSSGSDGYLAFESSSSTYGTNFNNLYFSHGHIGFMQMRGGKV